MTYAPAIYHVTVDVTITAPDVTEVEQTDFTNTYQVGNDRLQKALGGKGSLR